MNKEMTRRQAVQSGAALGAFVLLTRVAGAEEQASQPSPHKHTTDKTKENAVLHDFTANAKVPDSLKDKNVRKVIVYATDDDICGCDCGGIWHGWVCRKCGKLCDC